MDEFKKKKKGLPQEYKHYLTPPNAPMRKDRSMTRRQRRRLARATVELAKEHVTFIPDVEHPEKP